MTGLKICGLQPGDDLSFTADPGVTHIGVIFVPASRRYVNPEAARVMLQSAAPRCMVMGVFVNPAEAELHAALAASGVQGVQLHGDESPDVCQRLRGDGYTVWKSLSVPAQPMRAEVDALVQEITVFAACTDAILLDSAAPPDATPGQTGGHGLTFDWSSLVLLRQRLTANGVETPLWIAGGLRPDNVGALLAQVDVDGVDVSSGVELDGRKSLNKIQDMVKVVSGHERSYRIS